MQNIAQEQGNWAWLAADSPPDRRRDTWQPTTDLRGRDGCEFDFSGAEMILVAREAPANEYGGMGAFMS